MIFVEPSREKSQRQAMTMTPTPSQQISGLVAAAAASISLGVITPAARIAYDGGVSTTTLVAFRVAVATVITAALVALFRRPWAFNPAALRPTLATTLGILMVAFGYMSSVLFIPVSLSALIFFHFSNYRVGARFSDGAARAQSRHHRGIRRSLWRPNPGVRTELPDPGPSRCRLRPDRGSRRLSCNDNRLLGSSAHGRAHAHVLHSGILSTGGLRRAFQHWYHRAANRPCRMGRPKHRGGRLYRRHVSIDGGCAAREPRAGIHDQQSGTHSHSIGSGLDPGRTYDGYPICWRRTSSGGRVARDPRNGAKTRQLHEFQAVVG